MTESFTGLWLGETAAGTAEHGQPFTSSTERFVVPVPGGGDTRPGMRLPETPEPIVMRFRTFKVVNRDILRAWVPEGWTAEEAYAALDGKPPETSNQ